MQVVKPSPGLPVSLRPATELQAKELPATELPGSGEEKFVSVINKKLCQVVFFKLPGNG